METAKEETIVRPRIEDLEKKKRVEAFKEGLLKEVLGHANNLRNKTSLISAYVTGQMSINGLSWSDLADEWPDDVYKGE